MDFSFSDEQQAIRQLAREILEAEAPVERVKAAERSERWMDEALWKQLAEANLLGIAIPEELGGRRRPRSDVHGLGVRLRTARRKARLRRAGTTHALPKSAGGRGARARLRSPAGARASSPTQELAQHGALGFVEFG